MEKSGIYLIENTINQKTYIGSSDFIERRIREHYNCLIGNRHDNKYLQNSFNKYGNVFEYMILEYCKEDILIEREQHFINLLSPEYNICKIAGRTSGYNHTEESKKNMSIAKKKQYKEGFEVWNKGISPSQETRDKISKTLKGVYTNENMDSLVKLIQMRLRN